jgi:hypothetical protein
VESKGPRNLKRRYSWKKSVKYIKELGFKKEKKIVCGASLSFTLDSYYISIMLKPAFVNSATVLLNNVKSVAMEGIVLAF